MAEAKIAHHYVSTACLHDLHDRCRRTCKFCASPCACHCHLTSPETPEDSPQSASKPPEAQPVPETGEGHREAQGLVCARCSERAKGIYLTGGYDEAPLCLVHGADGRLMVELPGHTGRCGWRSDCTNPVTDAWLDVGSGLTYPLCTEHGNEATRRGWLRTVTP